jgi:hypothetical protein
MRSELRNRRDMLARKFLHADCGLVWKQALQLADLAVLCGAKTKAGHPCQRIGLLPSGRCSKHGGWTPARTPAQLEFDRRRAASRARVNGQFVKLEAAE